MKLIAKLIFIIISGALSVYANASEAIGQKENSSRTIIDFDIDPSEMADAIIIFEVSNDALLQRVTHEKNTSKEECLK